jgi:hypothetical protein
MSNLNNDMINKIQKWVTIDNTLREKRDKMKGLYDKKNQLESDIMQYANKNKLDNAVFNISDGKLRFTQKTLPFTISQKFLKEKIIEYFTLCQNNSSIKISSDNLFNYIMSKREILKKFEIKRDLNKK